MSNESLEKGFLGGNAPLLSEAKGSEIQTPRHGYSFTVGITNKKRLDYVANLQATPDTRATRRPPWIKYVKA